MLLKIVCILFAFSSLAYGIDNGLARTPAMGYNTWNDYGCNVSAQDVMDAANAFIAQNLTAYGYQYVNLDDCWAEGRYPNGTIYPDPITFPNGMAPLVEYVHSLGLKFGIYTDRGNYTCQHRPGSLGYEQIDADTYASWRVDYVKEDSCYATEEKLEAYKEYETMRDALNKTGRPIYFSLCGWHWWYAPPGNELGNSWRIQNDCTNWPTVLRAIDTNAYLSEFAGPGGWNDPDMLIGTSSQAVFSLPQAQSRTMFSMWAVMSAPLLIGSSIVDLNPFDLQTYTNAEVIAVNQDKLGKQGIRIVGLDLFTNQSLSNVWGRELAGGDYAFIFLNNGNSTVQMECDYQCFKKMGITNEKNEYVIRDLWAHTNNGTVKVKEGLTIDNVPPFGASVIVRLTPAS